MAVGILQDILEKAREVGACGNREQVTDLQLIKMLDSVYQNDFPDELRILKLKDVYTFNTIQGVDTYPFDFDHWSTVESPVTCSKGAMILYQNPSTFYNYNFNVQFNEQFAQANGTAGPYSGTTQGSPILRSVNNNPITSTKTSNTSSFPTGYPPNFSTPNIYQPNISRIQNILISANTANTTLHVTDDGAGNLIGDCLAGGVIDYWTGAITGLTFTQTIPSLVQSQTNYINIQYTQIQPGQPYTILFFQNQFVLRPVPDQAYTIEIIAYRLPSKALLGITDPSIPNLNGRPESFDWWELLSFMIAKKLYQNRLDMDGVQLMQAFIDDKISDARTQTYGQLGKRQCTTLYRQTENQQNQQSSWGWGTP